MAKSTDCLCCVCVRVISILSILGVCVWQNSSFYANRPVWIKIHLKHIEHADVQAIVPTTTTKNTHANCKNQSERCKKKSILISLQCMYLCSTNFNFSIEIFLQHGFVSLIWCLFYHRWNSDQTLLVWHPPAHSISLPTAPSFSFNIAFKSNVIALDFCI